MAPCSSDSCSSAEVERIFSAHLVRATAGARAKASDRDIGIGLGLGGGLGVGFGLDSERAPLRLELRHRALELAHL